MSPYDGMKLAVALRLLLRTGRRRPAGPPLEGRYAREAANARPSPDDLLDWQPQIQRKPDPGSLHCHWNESV